MNIIVQAGGKGSRLRHYTWNKPKCLVPVKNKPILYNLFDTFDQANFYIIGDYLYEKLESYLLCNPPKVNYKLIKANGEGTCSGISDAVKLIENEEPILVIWSDLYFSKSPNIDNLKNNTIFTTSCFVSRFEVTNNKEIIEKNTNHSGVAGLFYFKNKNEIKNTPANGEFLEYFVSNIKTFECQDLCDVDELGDFAHYEKIMSFQSHCRFFNQVDIKDNYVEKKCIDDTYKNLISWEQHWYDAVGTLKYSRIPKVLSLNPYRLEKIKGKHAFELQELTTREKSSVLVDMLDLLSDLHKKTDKPFNKVESEDVYFTKTYNRIEKIHNVLPVINKDILTINGKKCKNLFKNFNNTILDDLRPHLISNKFTIIHGDPTFSNSLVDNYLRTWLIDPRGYFSLPGIWGDPYYDFAKVYFSAIGNYDIFNRKKFKLYINESSIEVMMENNPYENIAKDIFYDYFKNDLKKIEIIHALIWIAFSGYAIDDLDSILAAHYLGLYWLECIYNS